MTDTPLTAVVTAEFEVDEGRRAVSFAVRPETLCEQLAAIVDYLPTTGVTWTAEPGTDDTTGHGHR